MKTTTAVIMALMTVALLLVAGCASKGTTGYATYSGNQPAAGGGGCGRFASTSADACVDAELSAEAAEAAPEL